MTKTLPPWAEKILLDNWKTVAKRSWSFWLILISGLLSGLELALPSLPEAMQFSWYNEASIVVAFMAAAARLLVQKGITPDA